MKPLNILFIMFIISGILLLITGFLFLMMYDSSPSATFFIVSIGIACVATGIEGLWLMKKRAKRVIESSVKPPFRAFRRRL